MTNPFHKLKIVSDAMSNCSVIEMDGVPLKNAKAISIELRSENFVVVKIEMVAEVDAEVGLVKWDQTSNGS
jgi:hypothetical protein